MFTLPNNSITHVKVNIFIVLLILIFIAMLGAYIKRLERVNCSSFSSQAKAQKLFDKNPEKYTALDKDDDGVPCEVFKY